MAKKKQVKYSFSFHYKGKGDPRPQEEQLHDATMPETTEPFSLSAVGDTVCFTSAGKMKMFKVLTRDFTYIEDHSGMIVGVHAFIVVTDVTTAEKLARVKT